MNDLEYIRYLMTEETDTVKMGQIGFKLRGLRARYKDDPVKRIIEQFAYLRALRGDNNE